MGDVSFRGSRWTKLLSSLRKFDPRLSFRSTRGYSKHRYCLLPWRVCPEVPSSELLYLPACLSVLGTSLERVAWGSGEASCSGAVLHKRF